MVVPASGSRSGTGITGILSMGGAPAIRQIRDHVFARTPPAGLVREPRPGGQERPAQTADRAALMHEHMARTARPLQAGAADYAALLEQRADLTRQPRRMDYPAKIKRWRAIADQAGRMARRCEQSPLCDLHREPAKVERQCRGQAARPADHLDGRKSGIAEWTSLKDRLEATRPVALVTRHGCRARPPLARDSRGLPASGQAPSPAATPAGPPRRCRCGRWRHRWPGPRRQPRQR
jgi:hypothetical protein